MGTISTKLDSSNKVIEIKHDGPSAHNPKTKITQESLNKYKENLNSKGFLIVNLKFAALVDLLEKYYNLAKEGSNEVAINNFTNPRGFGISLVVVQLFSHFGLYSIIEQPNYNPDKPEFIKMIIPMSLIKNDSVFINFVFTNFLGKVLSEAPVQNTEDIKKIFMKIIQSFNQNSSNPEIRLVNILNLSIHMSIIFAIASYSGSKKFKENPLLLIDLLTPLISSFPEDACYFDTNNLIAFTPDVCKKKGIESVGETLAFKYISIGLGILALLFFIMFLTKKPKYRYILQPDSDDD